MQTGQEQYCFRTGRDTLEPFIAEIGAILAGHGAPPAALHDISLALAEVLNNIARHAYRSQPGRNAQVCLSVSGRRATFTITDDGPEFDPLTAPRRDLATLAEHGMGIHLVTGLMTDVTYQRLNGRNQLTLVRDF